MGKYEANTKRMPGLARVLVLPIVGAVTLAAVITGGISRSRQMPPPTDPVVPSTVMTVPTVPPTNLAPNPIPPDAFYNQDGFLTTDAVPVTRGVDVSEHQQKIDWNQVAGAGMEFAFVRLGYRGYGNGELVIDHHAEDNLQGAADAGLQVGAYFFSQAMTPLEAAKEAAFCIKMLEDHPIDLPVVFDWEYISSTARTGSADMETVTQCALVFCRAMEAAGYQPMIYFNPHDAGLFLDLEQLKDYPFWLAYYSDTLDYPNQVNFWQYTCTGSVPGISTNTDINLRLTP